MLKPALDKENRTGQYEYIPKAMGYSRKNPSKTGDRGGRDMEFPRILKNLEIPGLIKKEVEFPQERSRKSHVE